MICFQNISNIADETTAMILHYKIMLLRTNLNYKYMNISTMKNIGNFGG